MPNDPFGPDGPPTLRVGSERLLDQGELSVLLESMRGAKVAVAGDFCLDSYWHLDEGPRRGVDRDRAAGPPRHQPAL